MIARLKKIAAAVWLVGAMGATASVALAAPVQYSFSTGTPFSQSAPLMSALGAATVSGTFYYNAAVPAHPTLTGPGGSSFYPDALTNLQATVSGFGSFSDVHGRAFVGDGLSLPNSMGPADFVVLQAEPGGNVAGAVFDMDADLTVPGFTLVNARLRWHVEILNGDPGNPALLFDQSLPDVLPPPDWPVLGLLILDFASSSGGANAGAVFTLENVAVTAVPEPETYALMLAGLGLLGFAARRKSR